MRLLRFVRSFSTGIPSMSVPFEFGSGVPAGLRRAATGSTDAVRVSTLANGVKVATADTQQPLAHVSIVVGSGSRDEPLGASGASHFLTKSAFLSSTRASQFMRTLELEKTGGSFSVAAARESVSLNMSALESEVSNALAVFSEAVTAPRFAKHEAGQAREAMSYDVAELDASPALRVLEHVHVAAFGDGALAKPVSSCDPSHVCPTAVKNFATSAVSNGPVVVAGVNVDHDELVNVTAKAFANVKTGNGAARKPSPYVGGFRRVHDNTFRGTAYGAVAFEGASAAGAHSADFAVIKALLGSASSSYHGEIGFGGVAKSLLGKFPTLANAAAFNLSYSDAGVVGLYFQSGAAEAGGIVAAIRSAVEALASGKVDEKDVSRAKAAVARELSERRTQAASVAADLASAVARGASLAPVSELVAKVNAVSAASVAKAAKAMISKPASVVAFGDTSSL